MESERTRGTWVLVMTEWLGGVALGAGASALVCAILVWIVCARYVKVRAGEAWVVSTRRGRRVALSSRLVWPGQDAQRVDLRPHAVDVALTGPRAAACADGAAVEVLGRMTLRIDRAPDAVLDVVEWLGVDRACDSKVIGDLYLPQLEEAIYAVAGGMAGPAIHRDRVEFRERVAELLAPDLRGFVIDDLAISTLQKIPKAQARGVH